MVSTAVLIFMPRREVCLGAWAADYAGGGGGDPKNKDGRYNSHVGVLLQYFWNVF
jgi:hypothetical protein